MASVSDMFTQFLQNLAVKNSETISIRYAELTKALNKEFRDTESETANSLQVGSFGRRTGINGISDLDMLYLMPSGKWNLYKDGGQYDLLKDTKDAILRRYPSTNVKVDRLVVTVTYHDFHVEVQPVFEQDDDSFKYPDTKNGGTWKFTRPREEMAAIANRNRSSNDNLRRMCKMARAWRNKHGVGMGGLLIDTLVYNYFQTTDQYDKSSYFYYDWLSRDFFKYLSELPSQDHYAAPGSGQRVAVKAVFQHKAKKAYDLCLSAINAAGQDNENEKWKKVFGRAFPASKDQVRIKESAAFAINNSFEDTEEFIEDKFPVDIRYNLSIDCHVKQDGFLERMLADMIRRRIPLMARKDLEFHVTHIDVPTPYRLMWKVLNRGDEAIRRNMVRGGIVDDGGKGALIEATSFRGDHVVECYAIKDGVVVATDRIHVPISNNRTDD